MDLSHFKVPYNKKIKLSQYSTDSNSGVKDKSEGKKLLSDNINLLAELQDKLYAYDKYALLLIFQAMDAAGKDGAIKHVMSGLNPQGTQVFSFKQPSNEELEHDYLWRFYKSLPERGRIGIFNRSYYEDVLVVRVHNLLQFRKLPKELVSKNIWQQRFKQMKNFEKHLFENGIITIKFFLNVSKEEQKKRFIKRIDDTSKNWKFSEGDIKERGFWNDYQKCYEDVLNNTSTKYSPWYVIPADKKWFARYAISNVIVKTLENLKLKYPELSEEQRAKLGDYKQILLNEK